MIVEGDRMMFNGLLMCGESDTSDLTKDTGLSGTESACSLISTTGGMGGVSDVNDVRCVQSNQHDDSDTKHLICLKNKLHATQLCLKNKEETIRVQAESLTCAEQRIALLTIRAAQQRRELENCQRELCRLRTGLPNNSCKNDNPCCKINQESQAEVENQKNIVVTLQNNLSIIEELYRECFYETAKQEELIEKLRKSYLDVRLMEKEKVDRIKRLENVVDTQKWSLESCQDIAMEVENLKLEILNFLNSSNNDSGMWEQSLAGEVGEDISDIMQQLHQLREILQEECLDTCTLKKENCNLRELVQGLECKINDICEQKCHLECTIKEKEDTINCLRRENDELCCTMRGLRCELECAKKRICEIQNEIECVRKQLQQAQEEVGETKTENCGLATQNAELTERNACLTEELERADDIIKENCKIRSEVQYLTQQVALWRQQLAESEARVQSVEAELARARSHCRNVNQCYKEKVDAVAALEVQLQEAHSRGAQLCAESRRVVATVRGWIGRMQATNAEQSQKIKAQESYIEMLQKALQERMGDQREDTPPKPSPSNCPSTIEIECPSIPSATHVQKEQSRARDYQNAREFESAQSELCKLVKEPCDYFSTYCTQVPTQPSFPGSGVGCSKCAAKRPTDPSRSPTDDSDDVVQVGCSKCAPKRKNMSKDFRSEITVDFQVGCSKCAPKQIIIQRNDNTEETESGSGRSQSTSAAKSCGCERDDGVAQVSAHRVCERDDGITQVSTHRMCERDDGIAQVSVYRASDSPSCSYIPVPPRRLLRKKVYNDRFPHFLLSGQRCAGAVRERGVQQPARADHCTSPSTPPTPPPAHLAAPPPHPHPPQRLASKIPRAVSPTSELLDRVSRLNDAMEESQRRWSRTKLPHARPQREHR